MLASLLMLMCKNQVMLQKNETVEKTGTAMR